MGDSIPFLYYLAREDTFTVDSTLLCGWGTAQHHLAAGEVSGLI